MQGIESIPVFRTRQALPLPLAKEAAATVEAEPLNIYEDEPSLYLGRIITQREMNILLDRGRCEGFGIQGEWQSDDYPCDWKVVKVWDLAAGYTAGSNS